MADAASPGSDRPARRARSPDESGAPAAPWWRRRGSSVAVIVGVVVALVVSGFVAADAFGSCGDDYRTATAARSRTSTRC